MLRKPFAGGKTMNDLERKTYERLTRVRDFGVTHATDFPAASLGGQLFAELNTVIEELTNVATNQVSGRNAAREGTSSKATARAALRERLSIINRTARALAIDQPGVAENFRMPPGINDQGLLNVARAFVANATPLADDFAKLELPQTFFTETKALIANFEQAITSRHQKTEAQVSATAAIDPALERGLNILRKLDVIVRNKFHDDPATLAAWESASHPERHARKTPPPPPDTTSVPPNN
jgi:hypothetical protein